MSNNKFKVLVVEDEANICSFIETLLETNGYQALVANTCAMGQTLFTSHNPDLIILDLGLPDRDGLELIRFVRQKFLTPIVVLSPAPPSRTRSRRWIWEPTITSPNLLAPASCWPGCAPPAHQSLRRAGRDARRRVPGTGA